MDNSETESVGGKAGESVLALLHTYILLCVYII